MTPRRQEPAAIDLVRAAADLDAAAVVLAVTPVGQLRRLDQQLRLRNYTEPPWFSQWYLVRPGEAAALDRATGRGSTVGALLSMHPNGHVREEAIELLAAGPASNALPFLVLRTADWVPEVQRRAQVATMELLKTDNIDALIAVAPLVETGAGRRAGSGRPHHGPDRW